MQFLKSPYLYYFKKFLPWVALGLISLLFTNLLDITIPYLIGKAVDAFTAQQADELKQLIFTLLAVCGLLMVFRFCWRYFWGHFHHNVAEDLKNKIFKSTLKQDPHFFSKTTIGDLMSLINNDVNAFRMGIGPGVLILLDGIILLIAAPIFLYLMSPKLLLYSVSFLLIVPFIIKWLTKKIFVGFKQRQDEYGHTSGLAQEIIHGFRTLKSYAKDKIYLKHFNKLSQRYQFKANEVDKYDSAIDPVMELAAGISSGVALLFGAVLVIENQLSIGELLAFYKYIRKLVWPMTALGYGISFIEKSKASFQRIKHNMSRPSRIHWDGKIDVDHFEKLEVKDLSYTTHEGHHLLNNISFSINKGETVALCGPTGSGKTTLLELLLGLNTAPDNKIFINGIDINQISKKSLWNLFSTCSQETYLFNQSLEYNLSLYRDIEDDLLHRACLIADIQEEVDQMPQNYKTMVGEKGVTLSGGQKQRITLARALYKKADILLLDDSLSSVDQETENTIFKKLIELENFKTKIIVTQKILTTKNFDKIILINNGGIDAIGTYEDLHKGSTLFQDLILNSQGGPNASDL